MFRFIKVLSIVFIFSSLLGCVLTPILPSKESVNSAYGLWAVPVYLHSTVLTRSLSSSDSLELRLLKLDGSYELTNYVISMLPEPSFYFFKLRPGKYAIHSMRLIGKNASGEWWAPKRDVSFSIKSREVTVNPEIYKKARYRVGLRKYREEFNFIDFKGKEAEQFVDIMNGYKHVDQWVVNWP